MSNLIRNHAVVDDDWTVATLPAITEAVRKQAGKVVIFKLTGEQSAMPEQIAATVIPAGKVIVPFPVWLARKNELAPRLAAGELGVWLESFELVEDLVASVDDINAFPVIAVNFPRFADGRGFSIAALLRTRYGYRNELRAIGDVLRDQLYYMHRCGFDAYAIRADRSVEEALASLRDFTDPYQGAVDNPLPVWRRHARHAHASRASEAVVSMMDDAD
ncbi:MAG TPA: DUF934 domain-containing protein [Novimethylophilus sp.]|jgi:uncharacterized protein (DUF934 family)|uniref:DUF934 domain-containing protein n=1 Tax=Novimethylophilus sp. TaxID=2137426 RepID=UPI002F3F5903